MCVTLPDMEEVVVYSFLEATTVIILDTEDGSTAPFSSFFLEEYESACNR
jgi:hypothetical protein